MKRISPWNSNSTGIAIALFVAVLAVRSRGVSADPGAADLVREAAAICRQVPDGKAEVGKSDARPEYDRIISSLSRSMLPDLEAISKSNAYSKLERRLAAILCRRIEHPEEFAKIQPYLIPIRDEYVRLHPPRREAKPRSLVTLRPIDDPELLAPRFRTIIEKNREVYDELRLALAQMRRDLTELPDGDYGSLQRMESQFRERAQVIGRRVGASERDVAALVLILTDPIPALDPKYAMAWEEALCRSRSSDLKSQLMDILIFLHVTDSAPIAGAQLNLGLRLGDKMLSDRSLDFFFSSEPTEALVDGLHDCLQELPVPERAKAEQEMRNYGSRNPRWRKFLSALKSDPEWTPKVAVLLGNTDTATTPSE